MLNLTNIDDVRQEEILTYQRLETANDPSTYRQTYYIGKYLNDRIVYDSVI